MGDDMPNKARSVPRLIATTVAILVAAFVAVDTALSHLRVHNAFVDIPIEAAALSGCCIWALWFIVLRPLTDDAEQERHQTAQREGELQREAQRQEFDASVHRAMEMAGTEALAYRAVERALGQGIGRLSAELLLADSSDAHLKLSAAAGPEGTGPGCGVESPRECPALRRSQTLVFASSEDIDACPNLFDRPTGICSAACVPVSVAGRSIGVLHATAPPGEQPDGLEVARLEALATQAGSRIGLLRVMEATSLQAATDPLTGLLNRRSFENRVQELLHRQRPFALAMGDLDHFKRLNDTHGHDAGDRALRLFARTVRNALRGQDLICRYGGEEFIIAFPDLTVPDTMNVLQRVQEELVLALMSGTVPSFTASFGVAHSDEGATMAELFQAADTALFRAKRDGRNRVVSHAGRSGHAVPAGTRTSPSRP
jgi:diguanylate cyclase (GGDEF)-like protein